MEPASVQFHTKPRPCTPALLRYLAILMRDTTTNALYYSMMSCEPKPAKKKNFSVAFCFLYLTILNALSMRSYWSLLMEFCKRCIMQHKNGSGKQWLLVDKRKILQHCKYYGRLDYLPKLRPGSRNHSKYRISDTDRHGQVQKGRKMHEARLTWARPGTITIRVSSERGRERERKKSLLEVVDWVL